MISITRIPDALLVAVDHFPLPRLLSTGDFNADVTERPKSFLVQPILATLICTSEAAIIKKYDMSAYNVCKHLRCS